MIPFVYDDGGRQAAGFKGDAGDCVTRAIAIATEIPYKQVYTELFAAARARRGGKVKGSASPRNGVAREIYDPYLTGLGWTWTPTMKIGSGTRVHVAEDELPAGRLILRLSRHLAAVVDGVLHDTYNCSREGTRAVYRWGLQSRDGSGSLCIEGRRAAMIRTVVYRHPPKTCRACGKPGTYRNPLINYEHDQGCMIYMASGTCNCGRPGYLAHKYRCPVPIEGDQAPPSPPYFPRGDGCYFPDADGTEPRYRPSRRRWPWRRG